MGLTARGSSDSVQVACCVFEQDTHEYTCCRPNRYSSSFPITDLSHKSKSCPLLDEHLADILLYRPVRPPPRYPRFRTLAARQVHGVQEKVRSEILFATQQLQHINSLRGEGVLVQEPRDLLCNSLRPDVGGWSAVFFVLVGRSAPALAVPVMVLRIFFN